MSNWGSNFYMWPILPVDIFSLGCTQEWCIFSSGYTQELNIVMYTLLSWVEYMSVYSTLSIEWILTHSTQLNWMHQLYSTQLNWVERNTWVWVYPYIHYQTGHTIHLWMVSCGLCCVIGFHLLILWAFAVSFPNGGSIWVYSYSGIPFYSVQLSRVELMHSIQLSRMCEYPFNRVCWVSTHIFYSAE